MEKKLEKAINEQINKEIYSAYLYLSMAAHFEALGLPGCASWMKLQSKEELTHAMKFFEFVNDRGGKVVLSAVDQPPASFKSVREIFEKTFEHEQEVTASINEIYFLAQGLKDTAATTFLHWFIDEQVEEEKNAMEILNQLGFIKSEESSAMLLLDKTLGARGAE